MYRRWGGFFVLDFVAVNGLGLCCFEKLLAAGRWVFDDELDLDDLVLVFVAGFLAGFADFGAILDCSGVMCSR